MCIRDSLEGAELDEPALTQRRETCLRGSPISRAILWRQFWQARRQSLAEVFADELTLSVNCVLRGDFVEGVRALLIDKDKSPRWQAPQAVSYTHLVPGRAAASSLSRRE